MDMGQKLTNAERDRVRNLASALGVFGYVEPKSLTPTWVVLQNRKYKILYLKITFGWSFF